MPANNRVHSSAALQTHGIWQSAIGYDPYAPSKDEDKKSSNQKPSSAADPENAYASFQGLLALARITGSNADETRGACKRCGRVGHLTFQCRNFVSVKDDNKDKDAEAIEAAVLSGLEKIKGHGSKMKGKAENEDSSEEEEESESSDSDYDSEMERAIAEKYGKKVSRKLKSSSKKHKKKDSDSDDESDSGKRKRGVDQREGGVGRRGDTVIRRMMMKIRSVGRGGGKRGENGMNHQMRRRIVGGGEKVGRRRGGGEVIDMRTVLLNQVMNRLQGTSVGAGEQQPQHLILTPATLMMHE